MLKISVILIHCLCYHCISIMVLNTKVKINNYISQLSISAWNVQINDNCFVEKLSSDINLLLETWPGVKPKANLQDYLGITYIQKGLESDLYVCAVYIPPASSTHFDNDIVKLENDISIVANR